MKKTTDGVIHANEYLESKRTKSEIGSFVDRMKEKQKVEREVERCRNCNAKSIRYRSKMESWVCTGCGFSWSLMEEREFQRIENTFVDVDFQIRYHLPLSIEGIENTTERLRNELE